MSILFNSFVVITIARTKSLQRPPLLMLSSLAVTDLLYSHYFILRYLEIFADEHLCPKRTILPRHTLGTLCLLATLGNLAIISRERYLAVKKPWWYRSHVTKLRAVLLICATWLISAIIAFFMYLSRKFRGQFPALGQIMSLSFYVVCFFVIVLSYLGLFCKKTPPEGALQIRAILEREKRTANTVALILLLLLITFLPGVLSSLVHVYAKGVSNQAILPFSGFFLQLNSLLNPLVNFGRSKDMRRALRNLLKCSQEVQPSTDETAA